MQPLALFLLLILFLPGDTLCGQADCHTPAFMPYATDAPRAPSAVGVTQCLNAASSIHGAAAGCAGRAAPAGFEPHAGASSGAVASVASYAVRWDGDSIAAYMPCADEHVSFLPCCRERMPCASEPGRDACPGPQAGQTSMPRADEIVVVPLFLPCAKRLELARDDLHMPRADEPLDIDTPPHMPRAADTPPSVKTIAADFPIDHRP